MKDKTGHITGTLLLSFIILLSFDPDTGVPGISGHGSESMEALEEWTDARSYPYSDIPPDRYYAAFQHARNHVTRYEDVRQSQTSWQSIGPVNVSGRMTCIAVNPLNQKTLYAGSASGGLWRSYTAGLGGDWERITTGFPVLGVNAIAIDPADTNTMYIGTGEVYRYMGSVGGVIIRTTRGSYGMGILKTTDGGTTWSKSLDWSYHQQRGVQAIRINPLNSATLYAATSEGVYVSRDAGTTWILMLNAFMATDVAVNALDTNQVITACGNFSSDGRGLYRSTDGGSSFSLIPGLPSYSGKAMLEPYGSNPNIVFASLGDSTTGEGSLWKTTNFGADWTMISNQPIYGVQGWYAHFVAVHPTDTNQVVRGGVRIYKSSDAGVTLTEIPGTWYDHHNYAHDPSNPDVLYMVDDGGVWRSEDFGGSYQDISYGLLTAQFYNGFSCSATDSNLALGQVQDHYGWMYTGSQVWPQGGVDEVGWTAIDQSNDSIMYAGRRGGGSLYKSTDRGMSYALLNGGFTGLTCWNTPFVLSRSNPGVLYFGSSIVYGTTDGGTTWSATNNGNSLDGNPLLCMAVAPTNADTMFVGTAPRVTRPHIYRTTNGGTHWTDVTGPAPDRYILDIAVDPKDSRVVYAVFGGFDTTRALKSLDAGTTWIDISGNLPNVPTTAIAIDPLNADFVYVGNDLGVFLSTDGGVNWMGWNDGLFEAVIVSDLVISPSNRTLRLATHSNGVFQRRIESTVTSVAESDPVVPSGFTLRQNYPNPFNPSTSIGFEMRSSGFLSLRVYDVLGREIGLLVNEVLSPGKYERRFDGSKYGSGVYYYTLTSGNIRQTKKMLLLR